MFRFLNVFFFSPKPWRAPYLSHTLLFCACHLWPWLKLNTLTHYYWLLLFNVMTRRLLLLHPKQPFAFQLGLKYPCPPPLQSLDTPDIPMTAGERLCKSWDWWGPFRSVLFRGKGWKVSGFLWSLSVTPNTYWPNQLPEFMPWKPPREGFVFSSKSFHSSLRDSRTSWLYKHSARQWLILPSYCLKYPMKINDGYLLA